MEGFLLVFLRIQVMTLRVCCAMERLIKRLLITFWNLSEGSQKECKDHKIQSVKTNSEFDAYHRRMRIIHLD